MEKTNEMIMRFCNVDENRVVLTPADRAVLESYRSFCEGLANYLGDGYEIVLHSLENLDRSVIKIINGYHTGRKEGAPITDLALRMLENIREKGAEGYIAYFSRNKRNEPLRSTTITIQGEGGRIIGLMCINFYMNTPLSIMLEQWTQGAASPAVRSETFVDDPEDLIRAAVVSVRDEVLADSSVTAHNKNKEIVARLAAKGIFKLKDSVVQCAEMLGISRNTVYMHIRSARGDGE